MKKKPKSPVKTEETYQGCLYGLESKNVILSGLCAPQEQLDWIGGTFQHIGDAYYNCWPNGGSNKWKNPKGGIHTTTDIELVKALLSNSERPVCQVTTRCIEELNRLGFSVQVLRLERFSYEVIRETNITHYHNHHTPIESVTKTDVQVDGKIFVPRKP